MSDLTQRASVRNRYHHDKIIYDLPNRRRCEVRDTRAPANPPKKDKEFKVLQRAKTLSSHRIFAPADVLAVEVFARPWKPATSTGGIAVEIGRLRTRALVS